MTTQELESLMVDMLADAEPGSQIKTFDEAGVITTDRGIVFRKGEDAFQITIVRSRGDDSGDEGGAS